MSLRRGDRTKPAPKHKNKFAFRHNKNSRLTKQIAAIPNVGLCARCFEVLEWRKKYRKYKVQKEPSKCTTCQQKTIVHAYHIVCLPCAKKAGCCAKCKQLRSIKQDPNANTGMTVEEVIELLRQYDIKERQRRGVLRDMEKGLVTCEQLKEALAAGHLPVASAGDEEDDEDDEDFEDEDDEDDEQENQPRPQARAPNGRGPLPTQSAAAKPTQQKPAQSQVKRPAPAVVVVMEEESEVVPVLLDHHNLHGDVEQQEEEDDVVPVLLDHENLLTDEEDEVVPVLVQHL